MKRPLRSWQSSDGPLGKMADFVKRLRPDDTQVPRSSRHPQEYTVEEASAQALQHIWSGRLQGRSTGFAHMPIPQREETLLLRRGSIPGSTAHPHLQPSRGTLLRRDNLPQHLSENSDLFTSPYSPSGVGLPWSEAEQHSEATKPSAGSITSPAQGTSILSDTCLEPHKNGLQTVVQATGAGAMGAESMRTLKEHASEGEALGAASMMSALMQTIVTGHPSQIGLCLPPLPVISPQVLNAFIGSMQAEYERIFVTGGSSGCGLNLQLLQYLWPTLPRSQHGLTPGATPVYPPLTVERLMTLLGGEYSGKMEDGSTARFVQEDKADETDTSHLRQLRMSAMEGPRVYTQNGHAGSFPTNRSSQPEGISFAQSSEELSEVLHGHGSIQPSSVALVSCSPSFAGGTDSGVVNMLRFVPPSGDAATINSQETEGHSSLLSAPIQSTIETMPKYELQDHERIRSNSSGQADTGFWLLGKWVEL